LGRIELLLALLQMQLKPCLLGQSWELTNRGHLDGSLLQRFNGKVDLFVLPAQIAFDNRSQFGFGFLNARMPSDNCG
jgi:hypothetical protein